MTALLIFASTPGAQGPGSQDPRLEGLVGAQRAEVLIRLAGDLENKNPKQGLAYAEEATRLALADGRRPLAAEAEAEQAALLMRLSRLPEAAKWLEEARTLAQRSGDPHARGRVFLVTGTFQEQMSEYEPALQSLYQALNLFEALNQERDSAATLNKIGLVNFRLNRPEETKAAWEQAMTIYQSLRDWADMAKLLNNLGVLAKNAKRYEEALALYRRAEGIQREAGDQRALADLANNIAFIRLLQRNLPACEEENKRALALREALGDKVGMAASCYNLAELYRDLNRLEAGRAYLQRAHQLAEESSSKPLLADCLNLESDYLEREGHPEQALVLFRKYHDMRDAIFTEESARQAAEIRTRYEVDRQKRDMDALRRDQAVRVRMLLGGLFFLAVVVALLAMRYRFKVKTSALIEAQNQDLRTMDRIVRSINREVDLQGVLESMMSRALELFPQADKAGLLVLDAAEGVFRFAAFRGASESEGIRLKEVRLKPADAVARYSHEGQLLEEGINITTSFEKLAGQDTMDGFPIPKAMLSMSISLEGQVGAFLILDSLHQADAFGSADVGRLLRFREHALTALFKAQVLHRVEKERGRAEQALEKLRLAYHRLDETAKTDYLTGLLNRREISGRLEEELIRCRRANHPCCLILADIDHFKRINDTFGHDAGDEVLKTVAGQLKASLRAMDSVGRWGGEEFLLLLPETPLEGAQVLAERIRSSIESMVIPFHNQKLSMTLTLGIAA